MSADPGTTTAPIARGTRIVAGFDGSRASIAAVDWAAEEAAIRRCPLRIVGAYALPLASNSYGYGTPEGWADIAVFRDECEAGLHRTLQRIVREHPEIGVDVEAVHGPAGEVLVTAGDGADLVIVGSSGSGARKSFLLGSVCATVMHRSPCPVVVVPPHVRHDRVERVVVGVDGSASADRAVRWATDEADRRGAALHVVHAWTYLYDAPPGGGERVHRLIDVDAALVVERAVELARERGLGNVDGEVVDGHATQCLLDASGDADLVVVGSHGRGGFRSMLFGSVAQNVAAHSAAPVAVVH